MLKVKNKPDPTASSQGEGGGEGEHKVEDLEDEARPLGAIPKQAKSKYRVLNTDDEELSDDDDPIQWVEDDGEVSEGEVCVDDLPRRMVVQGMLTVHPERQEGRSNAKEGVCEANSCLERVEDDLKAVLKAAAKLGGPDQIPFVPLPREVLMEKPEKLADYFTGVGSFDAYEKGLEGSDRSKEAIQADRLSHRLRELVKRCLGVKKLDFFKTPLFIHEQFPSLKVLEPTLQAMRHEGEMFRVGAVKMNNLYRVLKGKPYHETSKHALMAASTELMNELEAMARRQQHMALSFAEAKTHLSILVVQNSDLFYALEETKSQLSLNKAEMEGSAKEQKATLDDLLQQLNEMKEQYKKEKEDHKVHEQLYAEMCFKAAFAPHDREEMTNIRLAKRDDDQIAYLMDQLEACRHQLTSLKTAKVVFQKIRERICSHGQDLIFHLPYRVTKTGITTLEGERYSEKEEFAKLTEIVFSLLDEIKASKTKMEDLRSESRDWESQLSELGQLHAGTMHRDEFIDHLLDRTTGLRKLIREYQEDWTKSIKAMEKLQETHMVAKIHEKAAYLLPSGQVTTLIEGWQRVANLLLLGQERVAAQNRRTSMCQLCMCSYYYGCGQEKLVFRLDNDLVQVANLTKNSRRYAAPEASKPKVDEQLDFLGEHVDRYHWGTEQTFEDQFIQAVEIQDNRMKAYLGCLNLEDEKDLHFKERVTNTMILQQQALELVSLKEELEILKGNNVHLVRQNNRLITQVNFSYKSQVDIKEEPSSEESRTSMTSENVPLLRPTRPSTLEIHHNPNQSGKGNGYRMPWEAKQPVPSPASTSDSSSVVDIVPLMEDEDQSDTASEDEVPSLVEEGSSPISEAPSQEAKLPYNH
jgi:hypothetical protein